MSTISGIILDFESVVFGAAGYISEDSGVTFTQGTLVDEGDWGTNKRILAFHDLDISAQSGTAMCYKITTHNQSSSKETKVHATSIGWR